MRFNQFVFRNTVRNKSLYLAYFFSVLSTVMTFFTFSVFAFHPKLTSDLHSAVKTGMLASAIIIYLFSFLFVWYSVDIFLQSRKKEFGLLLIQGMSPKQLRKMIFQENMIVGFFATIFGSLVGLIFSQVILWLSRVSLHIDFAFYFPLKAIGVTFISFMILFLVISVFIQLKIPKMDIQTLLKSQDLGKGRLKPSKIKSVLAVALIGGGYAVALYVKGVAVVGAMLPVIFMVILGTSFLFNQLTLLIVNRLQKRESVFWKKTNMLVFSDLSFRMKDNAKSFFLVTVISTVAFSAIGTLIGFREMSLKSVNQTPYAITLSTSADEQKDIGQQVQQIEQELKKEQIDATKIDYQTLSYSFDDVTINVISQTDYNQLATAAGEKEIDDKEQAVLVTNKDNPMFDKTPDYLIKEFPVNNQEKIPVKKEILTKDVVPIFGSVVVLTNQAYESLHTNISSQKGYIWTASRSDYDKLVKLGATQTENPNVIVKASMEQMITNVFAPVLFIGLFIGIVFFISAGSFLYFRLYSDMNLDKEKFLMVHKIGFSKKEMKKVVYQQIAILFFTPIIVSCLHGIIALKAMYALFDQPLQLTAFAVLGTFIVIQIIYYLIARTFYFRKLYASIEN